VGPDANIKNGINKKNKKNIKYFIRQSLHLPIFPLKYSKISKGHPNGLKGI